MSGYPWFDHVQAAFPDGDLQRRIWIAASQEPTQLPQLFEDISRTVNATRHTQQDKSINMTNASMPIQNVQTTGATKDTIQMRKAEDARATETATTKKRKLEGDQQAPFDIRKAAGFFIFECKDVSFQSPARKKMKLLVTASPADRQKCEIRLQSPTTDDLEYFIHAHNIEYAFCLPVPEKQQRQQNFVLFPKAGAIDYTGNPYEPIVFVMNESAPTAVTMPERDIQEDDTYVTLTHAALEDALSASNKHVVTADPAEFASSIPQSHRKGEKAYHVKAHRQAKEGYLFFLPNGILFGFKKPLSFFPFSSIESISYTSVLQRTFNLVVSAYESPPPPPKSSQPLPQIKDVEFSMLDQEDFGGIDEYIKRHGLNDASMAAQRRAKAYNVNKEKKKDGEVNGDTHGGVEEEDGHTELQKAEQQLQDEEDEEEEDYEASGGESDGEGPYSDEDDEEGEYDDEGDEGAEDDDDAEEAE